MHLQKIDDNHKYVQQLLLKKSGHNDGQIIFPVFRDHKRKDDHNYCMHHLILSLQNKSTPSNSLHFNLSQAE
jgi:hypothetical protein